MSRSLHRCARSCPTPSRQQGIVVFVALIAVVLMSLAAVGLMRSVNTSTMVVGNLAFRQAAQAVASSAVERAVYDMFQPGTIADAEQPRSQPQLLRIRAAGRERDGRAGRAAVRSPPTRERSSR